MNKPNPKPVPTREQLDALRVDVDMASRRAFTLAAAEPLDRDAFMASLDDWERASDVYHEALNAFTAARFAALKEPT